MSEQKTKSQEVHTEEMGSARFEEFTLNGEQVVEKVKALIQEGNVRRIIFKTEAGRQLLDLPLTIGLGGVLVGTLLAPMLILVAAAVAVVAKVQVVVERVDPI